MSTSFNRNKSVKLNLLLAVSFLLFLYFQLHQEDIIIAKTLKILFGNYAISNGNTRKNIHEPDNYTFIAIICNGKENQNMSVYHEQLRHLNVMLKSAAMFTRSYLRFNMVVDSNNTHDRIQAMIAKWPEEYRSRLLVQYHKAVYPAGYEHLRNNNGPCQTLVLFLPDMFPDVDAAVVLDTDCIFLRSPEDLWEEFSKFNDMHLTGMALTNYRKQWHVYNSGMVMMNLTRIRQYVTPVGERWTSAMLGVFDKHKKFRGSDQWVLNLYFEQNPHLLYTLGCWWNFVSSCCLNPNASHMVHGNQGVSLLHGAMNIFMSNKEKKYKVIFQAMENHIIGSSVKGLVDSMHQTLSSNKVINKRSECDQLENIDDFLLREMKKYISYI